MACGSAHSIDEPAGSVAGDTAAVKLALRRFPGKVVRGALLSVRSTLGPDWEMLRKGCLTFDRSSRQALLTSGLKSASNFQEPPTDSGGVKRSPARRMASNPTKGMPTRKR